MNVKEAAELPRMKPRTIYERASHGRLPFGRPSGELVLDVREVEE